MTDIFKIFDDRKEILQDYCYEWRLDGGFEKLKEAREANDRREMIRLANQMWFALPDRESIRTSGFFVLCNLAEAMYDDDEEDEGDEDASTGA